MVLMSVRELARVGVPVVNWAEFLSRFRWRQGEHVSLIGHTSCGKSTLGVELLPRRRRRVVLATKPRDPLITDLVKKRGYYLSKKWPAPRGEDQVVLWPPITRLGDTASQSHAFGSALARIYRTGGWCVYADEVRYLTQTLGLSRALSQFWLQGRTLGISLMVATQEPTHIPLEAYSQATHLFLWRASDKRRINRLGEIGGVNTDVIKHVVQNLPLHDVLYVNTRDDAMCVTNVRS